MSAEAHLKGLFDVASPEQFPSDESLTPFPVVEAKSHEIRRYPIHMFPKDSDFMING
jgi:hypothetical protein